MIDLSIHPTKITINKSTKVTLRLTNTGVGTYTNVRLTCRFSPEILLVRGKKRLEIPRLRKGESYEHDLHLKARGTGEFQFSSSNFSYRDPFGQSVRPPQIKLPFGVVKPPPPAPPKLKLDPTSEPKRSLKLDFERGLKVLKKELQSRDLDGGHHFGHSSTSNIKRLATSSSKPQRKVSSTVGHEILSFEERAKLVEHLLAIASIVDRSRRATVILQLRPEIKTNVAYSSADKTHVFNIVETCLHYPNGMQELRDILQFFEHDSLPMQRFKEALNHLLPRELDFGRNDDQGQS